MPVDSAVYIFIFWHVPSALAYLILRQNSYTMPTGGLLSQIATFSNIPQGQPWISLHIFAIKP